MEGRVEKQIPEPDGYIVGHLYVFLSYETSITQ